MSGKGREDTFEKNRLEDFDLRELIFVDANIFVDMKYIFFLEERGLDIQKVEPKDVLFATMVGGEYRLLFTDSLHLSVMKRLKIKNIATRDSDFERAKDVTIWSP